MKIWCESSLCYVEPDTEPGENAKGSFTLRTAKNSHASYQILMRNELSFRIRDVLFVDLGNTDCRYNFQEAIEFEKGCFQDPLSNEKQADVEADYTQSIWITVYAGEQSEAAVTGGVVRVVTDQGVFDTQLELVVCECRIPSPKEAAFVTEYWMNTVNFWFRYPDRSQPDFIKERYGCEKYSEAWWKVNRAIAGNMKENRINILFVRTHDLLLDGGSTLDEEGNYHFKWELFDKWIDFFIKYADVRLFAGYHLVVQTEGRDVYIIDKDENGDCEIVISPIGSKKTERWLEQFLTALSDHLAEKGIRDRWYQHIEDEPGEAGSYCYGREMVRKFMPGIKCMDAIDNQAPMKQMQGQMDVWIPRVDIYEKNREFYDYRMGQGDGRWIYTCCEPHHHNYMNKMMGFPLLHTRLIGWACFYNHFSGFLHWGYNFWDANDIYFGLNRKNICKGDGYIVYPDAKNYGIKNSVRMISTRDSARDYELLKLLADRNPKKAFELAGRAARRFNDFLWDGAEFEKIYGELLDELDKITDKEERE